MMPLNATYEQESDIPASYKPLYSESEGKWVIEPIEGLVSVSERDRILNSLSASRNDTKAIRDQLKPWTSLGELEDVQSALDRIPSLEAAAKGNDEEAIKERLEASAKMATAPLQRQLEDITAKYEEAVGKVEKFRQDEVDRTKSDRLREVLMSSGIKDPNALNMALQSAMGLHELSEDGSVRTNDRAGLAGLSPDVWVKDFQKANPFLWPESVSANARGGKGNSGGASNPWLTGNLTEQSQLLSSDRDLAKQYFQQAGKEAKGLPVA